ncbi:MAG TPA: STAS domain-containing protein [Virgibacillus sp.]|nr:STAS domain-containing protein [Virgibacillus sp.]
MDLSIKVDSDNEVTYIYLAGEVDAYTAPKLKEAVLPKTEIENHVVKVDLGEVNYMDSTGLGVFISALKSTKENNSHLKLVHLQDRVARLFRITGLDEVIDINSTIEGGNN